jgi:hypothetical protein
MEGAGAERRHASTGIAAPAVRAAAYPTLLSRRKPANLRQTGEGNGSLSPRWGWSGSRPEGELPS